MSSSFAYFNVLKLFIIASSPSIVSGVILSVRELFSSNRTLLVFGVGSFDQQELFRVAFTILIKELALITDSS